MSTIVRCPRGIELRDGDEARLITRVQEHAREAHDLTLSDEQLRAHIRDEAGPPAQSVEQPRARALSTWLVQPYGST